MGERTLNFSSRREQNTKNEQESDRFSFLVFVFLLEVFCVPPDGITMSALSKFQSSLNGCLRNLVNV